MFIKKINNSKNINCHLDINIVVKGTTSPTFYLVMGIAVFLILPFYDF